MNQEQREHSWKEKKENGQIKEEEKHTHTIPFGIQKDEIEENKTLK